MIRELIMNLFCILVPSAKGTRVTIWKVAFSSNVCELLWFALFSGNTDCMNFRNLKTRKLFSYKNGFALSSTRLARDSSVSWQNPKKLKSLSLHFTSFRDDSGKAWITFKQKGKKGERGYLKQFPSSEDANLPTITATNALFNIEKIRQDSLVISIKDHGLKFKIVAPFQTFNSIHTKSVSDWGTWGSKLFFQINVNFRLQV